MTQRLNDPSHLLARETSRDQLGLIKRAHKDRVAWNTPDAADADYSFVPGRLLWSQEDQGKVDEARGRRSADFDRIGTLQPDPTAAAIPNIVVNRLRPRRTKGAAAAVARYRDHGDPALEAMLAIFDDELGEGVVTPDHYLTVANGDGKRCPATEPEETGLAGPWPPMVDPALADAGAGVRVAVIDTGWHSAASQAPGPTPYLASLVDGEAEPPTRRTNACGCTRATAPSSRASSSAGHPRHRSRTTGSATAKRSVRDSTWSRRSSGPWTTAPGHRTSSTSRRAATRAATTG